MDHSQHGHHVGMDMPTDMSMPTDTSTGMPMPTDMPMPHDMMKMYFHVGYTETILFSGWKTTSVGGIVASCIGIFFIAIIYEALKYFREYLFKKSYASVRYSAVAGDTPGKTPVVEHVQRSIRKRILNTHHFAQTALHIIQVTISYFLMLIFMTYNVWLCLAVVVGAGVGFFIFGWKKSMVVDITEHCH